MDKYCVIFDGTSAYVEDYELACSNTIDPDYEIVFESEDYDECWREADKINDEANDKF